jgi:hypothetical protein
MASNNRQTNLFAVEDWKKLYTTFSEADFQSYDFETIRKVMVDYLRTYYAEDYNDFIESSEFIALIDLIAFQAQSLAFRTDLNARENFLETAERKDSVLRLAKQLNYIPNRNKAANGLLKIQSINTTETIYDYSSINLARTTVSWNDPTNADWSSQFSIILNAALSPGQRIGKPFASKTLNGIKTEQYNIALPSAVSPPVFPFNASINDVPLDFEAVSASITNSDSVLEMDPGSTSNFGIIFQNDGRSNSSSNTGFFLFFKQGTLNKTDIALVDKIPNRLVSINLDNINNEDIWWYSIDSNGLTGAEWTKIPAISGSNAIYNSTAYGIRTLFSVNTRANDQIDYVFGDDTFANIPLGNYRAFFRISAGITYRISPADLSSVSIVIPYIDKKGQPQRLTIVASLQYTVANSSRRDLIQEIKDKAPQNFYTQGRMVNGEDYNIVPYTSYPDIIKVKSVNRYSSGISRYLDIIDPTGKYSSTDLFGSDGSFYKDSITKTLKFTFGSRNDVLSAIFSKILPILSNKSTIHFYYENFPSQAQSNVTWSRSTNDTTTSTGFFIKSGTNTPQPTGNYSTNLMRYLLINSLIRFKAPTGYYFDSTNSLIAGAAVLPSDKTDIWATIKSQIGAGDTGVYLAGRQVGAITLSDTIPTGAIVTEAFAPFTTNFTNNTINTIVTYILNNVEFALRYDYTNTSSADPWKIVPKSSIDVSSEFNLATAGSSADSSWFILFETNGVEYTVTYRGLDYIFSSSNSIRFLNSNPKPVYDSRTNTLVQDNIKVLQTNLDSTNTTKLSRVVKLQIYENSVESDGYIDSTKIKVTFPTSSNSDIPLDPAIFSTVVNPNSYTFYQKYVDYDNLIRFQLLDSGAISYVYPTLVSIENVRNNFPSGRIFYATTDKKFYQLVSTGSTNTIVDVSSSYKAYTGRQNIIFQYQHNASDNRRIDPAASNLIDCYILTRSYDEAYRNYITDYTNTLSKPAMIDSITLNSTYSQLLDIKMISDEMILNSGSYKPLFGNKANPALQATFQIVKNPSTSISDNELKSMMISEINNYFALENWDFGKTFYFSELSAYLHSKLGTYLSSVILIPTSPDSSFGDLYEIRSQPNEILINAATVDNITVVSGVYVGINQSGVSTILTSQI